MESEPQKSSTEAGGARSMCWPCNILYSVLILLVAINLFLYFDDYVFSRAELSARLTNEEEILEWQKVLFDSIGNISSIYVTISLASIASSFLIWSRGTKYKYADLILSAMMIASIFSSAYQIYISQELVLFSSHVFFSHVPYKPDTMSFAFSIAKIILLINFIIVYLMGSIVVSKEVCDA